MPRKKLIKLEEIKTFENVFNYFNGAEEKDIIDYFGNNNPITLEVGCGQGDYSLNLARMFTDRNFLGVDFKGGRIHTGSRTALEEGLSNTAFLWIKAEKLSEFFKEKRIEEIFIPFPDPHVKRRVEPRRLISQNLLDTYKKILTPKGRIHFKTDNDGLYRYGLKTLKDYKTNILFHTEDLYSEKDIDEVKKIKTRYEEHYLAEGRKIKYIEFTFD